MAARLLAATVIAAFPAGARRSAQDYPHKVVTVIVPYPAGGLGDILPRAMADALTQQMGVNFIVDNRPGATQIIAARLAASAKPDGATVFFGSVTALAINPSLKKVAALRPGEGFRADLALFLLAALASEASGRAADFFSECARPDTRPEPCSSAPTPVSSRFWASPARPAPPSPRRCRRSCMELLVVLKFRSSHPNVPQGVANFGMGPLAAV